MSQLESNTNPLMRNQAPAGDKMLSLMLEAMEIRVGELKQNVNVSQEMFLLGVDTDLIADLKQAIRDPMSHLLGSRDDIDTSITRFFSLILKRFFKVHNSILRSVVRTDLGTNRELHFSIVLNEDTFENRSTIMSFLKEYKTVDFWESFPVKFQFVPEEFLQRIPAKEVIV